MRLGAWACSPTLLRAGSAMVAVLVVSSAAIVQVIDFSAHSYLYFSNTATLDRATAILKGRSCDDAVFSLTIQSGSAQLFHREIPMAQLISCDSASRNPEEAKWLATRAVDGAVNPKLVADLHCGDTRAIGCWSSPILERLRSANLQGLCFRTNAEDISCVAFDPESKNVVEVWRHSE
jgi:hypothetical protein